MTSRAHAKRLRRATIGTMVAAAGLGLAACAPASNAPAIAAVELHPTGPAGAWFHDAYAQGADEVYETRGMICAIEGDVVVESLNSDQSIVATSLTTGDVVWQRESALCVYAAPQNDLGLLVTSWSDEADGEYTQELVDPVTGEVLSELAWGHRSSAQTIGSVEDVWVMSANGQYVGIREGDTVWTSNVGAFQLTMLLDEPVIASHDVGSGTVTLIDATTGQSIVELKPDAGHFGWATDGLLLLEDDDDASPTSWAAEKSTYRLVDLTGAEVGDVSATTNIHIVPGWREGVTLPLDDYVQAPSVYAVAHDGTPALYVDNQGDSFTSSGAIDLPTPPRNVVGVSTSGTAFLFFDHTTGLTLVDHTGAATNLETDPKNSAVTIRDGYIVVGGLGEGARILLPNAE